MKLTIPFRRLVAFWIGATAASFGSAGAYFSHGETLNGCLAAFAGLLSVLTVVFAVGNNVRDAVWRGEDR